MTKNSSTEENIQEIELEFKVENVETLKEEENNNLKANLDDNFKLNTNIDLKCLDNFSEHNSDSNKSQPNLKTPNILSSTGSNKDGEYMTPKSMHNLNLLFTDSNGKKSICQKRLMNNVK